MRIALLQCEPPLHQAADRVRSDRVDLLVSSANHAKAAGAQLLVTPECFLNGYNIGPDATSNSALDLNDDTLKVISGLAKELAIGLIVGFVQRSGQDLQNVVALWDSAGEHRLQYQKTHLFGEIDRCRFTPGNRLSPVISIDGVKIALAICFDIEFPEVAREYALMGADLIVVPTASMVPYDGVPLRLIPARAEENGVFVAYANYCGQEQDLTYSGLSCVCGPSGEDLVRADRTPDLLFADVDSFDVQRTRQSIDYLTERRVGLYPRAAKEDRS